ncbi:MAG: leucyl/phenylalanyl-tRNA--protein transferase [Myxococcota bacterium]
MIWRLAGHHFAFPPPERAEPSGLLAVGGDLRPERVLSAYNEGIFPWFSEGQPLLWWSPDPRAVIEVSELRVQRSLRKRIRQTPYRITLDTAFDDVIAACATAPRPDQDGTWITAEMVEAYRALHAAGHAHSAEAWLGDELVGGLYGLAIGTVFCGESMFARASDASKIAFVHLVRQIQLWGFTLVDCQMQTQHLARFGATDMARDRFLYTLRSDRDRTLRAGPWSFDPDFACSG